MRKILFIILMIGAAAGLFAETPVAKYGQLSVAGTKLVDKNKQPVQLKGMSAFWLNWYGQYSNYNSIKWLRDDWNITLFRAAVGVEPYGAYVTDPATATKKAEEIVNACIDLGVYVIIDWHAHHALDNKKQAIEFFNYMSKKYGQYPNVLYEIWNEPIGESWDTQIKPYAEEIARTIRANDPDGIVLVGNSTWSQDVDKAAKNPIKMSNIMYVLHFYSGTHGEGLRAKANEALRLGAPIFVTEFGVSAADGGSDGKVYLEEADRWMAWMDANKISWANWSLCDKSEASAALKTGASVNGGWSEANLTESGKYVRNKIKAGAANNTVNSTSNEGFYIENGILKDVNKNTFVIRGVNNPHIWWDKQSYDALSTIKGTGANTVRIVWETKGSAARLEEIIKRVIELKMIAMPELHDVTGSDDAVRLNDMAKYWSRNDIKNILEKYRKYILVNIANEWGSGTMNKEKWRDAYKTAIATMRNAGIKNTIVIDGYDWGKSYDGFRYYGQELLSYDGKLNGTGAGNLLFDVHFYWGWDDINKIRNTFEDAKNKKFALVVGEFGYNKDNGNNNLGCKVPYDAVLSECQRYGIGYIPWSWSGNNSENAWLDMVSPGDWKTLTWWGNVLVNGANGIKATSKECSVYKSTIINGDARLSSLGISAGNIGFDMNKYQYSITVENNTSTVNISAVALNRDAVISGTGMKNLIVGVNRFDVKVTHKSDTKVYTVSITRKQPGDNVLSTNNEVIYRIVNDWGTGFTGEISIINKGKSEIKGWKLEFDLNSKISEVWNAKLISVAGNRYTIINSDWNGSIPVNGKVTFGFNANAGSNKTLANCKLNGYPVILK